MTLNEMKMLYEMVIEPIKPINVDRFTVRGWDGMDGCWCDVVVNVDLAFALLVWCAKTQNGTRATPYNDIDYYRIFLADTAMLWSGKFTMRGEP